MTHALTTHTQCDVNADTPNYNYLYIWPKSTALKCSFGVSNGGVK